jgi:hypothetical protein
MNSITQWQTRPRQGARASGPPLGADEPCNREPSLHYRHLRPGIRGGMHGRHCPRLRAAGEKDAKLAQKLGQLQPFIAVYPQECMGQLASFDQPNTFLAAGRGEPGLPRRLRGPHDQGGMCRRGLGCGRWDEGLHVHRTLQRPQRQDGGGGLPDGGYK